MDGQTNTFASPQAENPSNFRLNRRQTTFREQAEDGAGIYYFYIRERHECRLMIANECP